MSPVLILSRLCLNRRFQFFGISETSSRSTSRTFLTVSSSITRRKPASAAFSVGTRTVMSLWRILIVRYSRRSPSISFVPAAQTDGPYSSLQVPVHEVDLLQPAQALADVLRPDLADSLDRLQVGVGRGEQLIESAELADDLRHDHLGQARDAT